MLHKKNKNQKVETPFKGMNGVKLSAYVVNAWKKTITFSFIQNRKMRVQNILFISNNNNMLYMLLYSERYEVQ